MFFLHETKPSVYLEWVSDYTTCLETIEKSSNNMLNIRMIKGFYEILNSSDKLILCTKHFITNSVNRDESVIKIKDKSISEIINKIKNKYSNEYYIVYLICKLEDEEYTLCFYPLNVEVHYQSITNSLRPFIIDDILKDL